MARRDDDEIPPPMPADDPAKHEPPADAGEELEDLEDDDEPGDPEEPRD